jgi:hypothetical protein
MDEAIGSSRSHGSVGVECDEGRFCRIVESGVSHSPDSASPSPGSRHFGAVHQRKRGAKNAVEQNV